MSNYSESVKIYLEKVREMDGRFKSLYAIYVNELLNTKKIMLNLIQREAESTNKEKVLHLLSTFEQELILTKEIIENKSPIQNAVDEEIIINKISGSMDIFEEGCNYARKIDPKFNIKIFLTMELLKPGYMN